MYRILNLALLALVLYAPGWAAMLALRGGESDGATPRDGFELLFFQVGTGVAVGSTVALILALAGLFSGVTWASCCIVFTLAALAIARPDLRRLKESLPIRASVFSHDIAVLAVLLLSLALFLMPFMNVFGQGDEGIYPNTAAHIKREGSVFITDTLMEQMTPEQRELFYYTEDEGDYYERDLQEQGFMVRDFATGSVIPQFVFLFPALMAAFMAFVGPKASFLVVPMFGVLSVWALYMVGRELAGRWAGLLASLLLSVCFLQVFFAKYSTSEMAIQFFFLFGLFAFLRYRRAHGDGEPTRVTWSTGAAAGIGFSLMMLTHVESFFVLVPLAVLLLVAFIDGGLKEVTGYRHFLAFLVPGTAAAVLLGVLVSTRYTTDSMKLVVTKIPGGWYTVGAAAAAGLAVALALRWPLGGVYRYLLAHRAVVLALLALALVILVAFAWFVRPVVSSESDIQAAERKYNGSNLSRLAFYLTPLGVLLALAGYCVFIFRGLNRRTMAVLFIGLFFSGLFLYKVFAQPVLVWSMRRYVPVVVPVAMLMVSYGLTWSYRSARGRGAAVARAVSAAVAVALVAWLLALSLHVAGINQTSGSYATVHEVADIASSPAVIVCDTGAAHHLAAPLRYFFGRQVAGLRNDKYVDLPGFERFLEMVREKGLETYMVTTERDRAAGGHRFAVDEVGEVNLEGRFLLATREKPTTETVHHELRFYVYRISE